MYKENQEREKKEAEEAAARADEKRKQKQQEQQQNSRSPQTRAEILLEAKRNRVGVDQNPQITPNQNEQQLLGSGVTAGDLIDYLEDEF